MTIEYRIGDCLELMKELPDASFDLVLTDPPFNVGIDYGDKTNDIRADDDYEEWFVMRLVEMARVIKPGHAVVVFTSDKKIHPIMNAVERTGLTFHHFLKWHKPTCQRALSGLVLFYRTELAFLLTSGKPDQSILNRKVMYADTIVLANTTPDGGEDVLQVNHPCRRPSGLYRHYIEGLTNAGGTVLDPFLGSGSVLLACRQTNRNGVGFEINPEYEPLIKTRTAAEIPMIDSWGASR